MSKSKTVVIAKPRALAVESSLDPTHAGNCHHYARLHLAIGAAYAVLCGVELQRIQRELKKTATRGSFEDWLEENKDGLGFGPRHAFKYKAIAEHVKSKLLVQRDDDVMALLDRAPSSLSDAEQKTLLKAIDKSVDGQSIRELLEELRIARAPRQLPDNPNPANNGSATRKPADTSLIIQDELFGRLDSHGKMFEWWAKPVRLAGTKESVPVWQTMTEAQKTKMERQLEISIKDSQAMLAQLREGRKGK